MKFISRIGLVVACLTGQSVFAAIQPDWSDCVKEASASNQRLQSARQAVDKETFNKKSADSVYLPTVSASAGSSLGKNQENTLGDSSSVDVSASQLIYDWGRSKSQTQKASALVESAKVKYQLASATVRYRLRNAYIGVLKAQELVDISSKIVDRRQKSARLIKLRYEAGREHKGSLLTSEAKQMQAELQLKKAQRDLEIARYTMAIELGRDPVAPVTWNDLAVRGEMTINIDYSVAPDFYGILKDVPDLKELLIQSQLAKYELESAKSEFYPSIKVNAGTDDSSGDWPDFMYSWRAGVSMSIPLFEGGRNKAKYDSAKIGLLIAGHDEFNGRNDLASAIRRKWSSLQDALDRMHLAKQFYEAARERARISQVQYASGIVNYDNWIIIEDEYINSEQSMLDANAGAMSSEADWINVKGGTLEQEYK
jgi:outer membrane protein TolC